METDAADFSWKKENTKKFKNNQRFKAHHKPAGKKPVETNKPSETKKVSETRKHTEEVLPNNWSKYEIQSVDECSSETANFENLLDNPVSQASYFKFKNEENWSKSVEFHSQFQKYFILDMNLLNAGVSCVKFSERHGYNDAMFKTLDDTPEKVKSKYEAYLKKVSSKKTTVQSKDIKSSENKSLEKTENRSSRLSNENQNSSSEKLMQTIVDDDDIDDLLKDKCNITEINECIVEDPLMSTTIQIQTINTTNDDDLEQWLDDILED